MTEMRTKRGFVLALLTLVLFMSLLALVVNLRTERGKVSSWTQDMMDTRKLLYTTDDVAEDVRYTFGFRVERTGDQLRIYDRLPANYSVSQALKGYNDFVKTKYITPDMQADFLDDGGNVMDLDEIAPVIIVYPYNITYQYPNYGKRELSVDCGSGDCNNSLLNRLDLEFNLTDTDFTDAPVPGNESSFNWAPVNLYNGDCTGDSCINFSLVIRDRLGQVFTCPGPICNYTQFGLGSKSKLTIHAAPCWFSLRLADQDSNIFLVRMHEPGNENQNCSSNVTVITGMTFPSADFYLNLPGFIRVKDVNYNFTRTLNLPGENLSARSIDISNPAPEENQSECFNMDGDGAWAGGSSSRYVYGVQLSNTCDDRNIQVIKMNVSWVTDSSEQIEVVNINGTSYWVYNGAGYPDGRQNSGTELDIVDYTILPSSTVNITYFRFKDSMLNKTFTVNFTLGDGTSENLTFGT